MKHLRLSLLAGSIAAIAYLTGCAEAPTGGSESMVAADSMTEVVQAPEAPVQTVSDNENELPEETASAQRPQLIKKASLFLSVESVEESITQVRDIVNKQQGDVLSLDDQRIGLDSSEEDREGTLLSARHQQPTTFELRVPQNRFDSAVDALSNIGEVQSRSINTEDVSSQLVDLQARISNARKSEEALKEIMSRSGEISDVLEVSRELSNVRQEIEQMSAAQKNLQTQVSYSTIRVSLESAIAQPPNQPAFSRQIANTWKESTSSVTSFTTDLLQLGLWLLVYSPYVAVLTVGAVAVRRIRRGSIAD